MIMCMALAVVGVSLAGDISMRGELTPRDGRVLRIDANAVVVAWPEKPGTPEQISLDRVRSVTGPMAESWSAVAENAERLWRARSRLDRGDALGAEPLFESLIADYRGERGPTAAIVSEGLLRCRLARQAHTSAIEPWLDWLASGGGDATSIGMASTLGSREVTLIAAIPPIWSDSPALRAFASTADSASRVGPARTLMDLYLAAARFETEGLEQPIPSMIGSDPAVSLVRDVVAARVTDARARAIARDAIRKRLETDPPNWVKSWCLAALGRSLIRESDIESRRRGIVELISVHTLHSADVPFLAGLALADAAHTCEAIGESESASVLWRELQIAYPGHPSMKPGLIPVPRPRATQREESPIPDSDEGG